MNIIKRKKRNNAFIEGLYEMAKSTDSNGLSVFDEQKFRREMAHNTDFMKSNRITFEEKEPKFRSCKRFDRCPVCEKCRTKASHLYVSCQTCQIPICVHDYKSIQRMIRRENFVATIRNPEIKKAIIDKRNKVLGDK